MRLIDADALQRRMCGAKCGCEYEDCGCEGDCGYDHFIFHAPAIDPASLRPKGEWSLHGNDDDCGCSYFCNKCGANYDEDYFYEHNWFIPFNFCPNCGADMKGEA